MARALYKLTLSTIKGTFFAFLSQGCPYLYISVCMFLSFQLSSCGTQPVERGTGVVLHKHPLVTCLLYAHCFYIFCQNTSLTCVYQFTLTREIISGFAKPPYPYTHTHPNGTSRPQRRPLCSHCVHPSEVRWSLPRAFGITSTQHPPM